MEQPDDNVKSTALVTGASSGIGLELAREFAKHRIDVILVARSQQKLSLLAAELEKTHGITTHILAVDLSRPGAAKRIFEWCENEKLSIDYLVNNAGFGEFKLFSESEWEVQEQMINLNITALTQLTHLFLPQMIERKSGRILNLASTAAFQPGPTMSVYYASKAFVLHFSEAIANELKPHGISVTALCPGPTSSGFQEAADLHESKLVKGRKLPSSSSVARYGFRAMMRGKTVAIHGWLNYLLANSVRFTPRSLVVRITRFLQDT